MKKHIPVLILMLVMSVTLSGCGLFRRSPSPTATLAAPSSTSTPGTSAQPEATTAPEGGEMGDDLDVGEAFTGLENLQSYQSRTTFIVDGLREGEVITSTTEILSQVNRGQNAHRVTMKSSSSKPVPEGEEGFGDVEIVQIADKQWTMFGDQWIEASGREGPDYGDMAPGVNQFPVDSDKAQQISADEMVNGVSTRHYRFGIDSLSEEDLAEMGSVESYQSDLWVEKAEGYIVKYTIVAEGNGLTFEEEPFDGKMEIQYEVFAINQPVTIEQPEVAGTFNLPGFEEGTFPMLSDAEVQMSGMGVVTYQTETSVEDALAFYQEELAPLGWEIEGEPSTFGGFAFLSASKDGFSLSLNISTDDETERTVVNASSEEIQ